MFHSTFQYRIWGLTWDSARVSAAWLTRQWPVLTSGRTTGMVAGDFRIRCIFQKPSDIYLLALGACSALFTCGLTTLGEVGKQGEEQLCAITRGPFLGVAGDGISTLRLGSGEGWARGRSEVRGCRKEGRVFSRPIPLQIEQFCIYRL